MTACVKPCQAHLLSGHESRRTLAIGAFSSPGDSSALICDLGLGPGRQYLQVFGNTPLSERFCSVIPAGRYKAMFAPGVLDEYSVIHFESPLHTYQVDLVRFQSIPQPDEFILTQSDDRFGFPDLRFLLDGQAICRAWTIWAFQGIAEIALTTVESFRGMGLGKALLSQLSEQLMGQGLRPVIVIPDQDLAGISIAKAVGFVPESSESPSGAQIAVKMNLPS
jgi:GNAT superfamily N-acetyltransferase